MNQENIIYFMITKVKARVKYKYRTCISILFHSHNITFYMSSTSKENVRHFSYS